MIGGPGHLTELRLGVNLDRAADQPRRVGELWQDPDLIDRAATGLKMTSSSFTPT
jgi:hypothetical protein